MLYSKEGIMSSIDSGHGESLCTPRRVQKRLFGPGGSSSKSKLFREQKPASPDDGISGEESDLGPMSPLALSDQSPCSIGSSPDRCLDSTLLSFEGTPRSRRLISWDRLTPKHERSTANDCQSPFSALKRLTRAARSSPRRKIFPDSPKSEIVVAMNVPLEKIPPATPKRGDGFSDDAAQSTPRRSFGRSMENDAQDSEIVAETPQKDESPEHRLITPLGSVSKDVPLPRLHRRKSLSAFDLNGGSSPERKESALKRHAHDAPSAATFKLFKTDENSSIPKARAALFREDKPEFKLSTKMFYSSSSEKPKRERSVSVEWRDVERSTRRHSLPLHATTHRRTAKRRKLGEINAGVSHGIRKPKPKRHVSRSEAFKKERHSLPDALLRTEDRGSKSSEDIENNPPCQASAIKLFEASLSRPERRFEKLPSPEPDPNKKFFKTNRTIEPNRVATVTVNNKIKLQVSNGKIELDHKKIRTYRSAHKKLKLADIVFDTTDLTVDEPKFEVTMEQDNVASILKVLEDDWADDDYDSMGPAIKSNLESVISPMKSMTIPKDVVMSPASELSNMTSVMNIKDAAGSTSFANILGDANDNAEQAVEGGDTATAKYYPLFTKRHVAFKDTPDKKEIRGIKRVANWQMSSKVGGADDQYQLDAGQKRFGPTQCTECGVVYQMGEPEDENAHLNYHNSHKTLKFPGWKKERVIATDPYTSSRIILMEPSDSKQCWKKVSEVLSVADRDLGLVDMKLSEYRDKPVYMYIRDKCIVGVLVAEHIKTAHRMIPDLMELNCCTAESTPVKCGINVVWTAMSHRRMGIATKLVDVLRANFYFGYVMTVDDIAFSMPTPSGRAFAESYTKTRNFKVYN